MKKRIEKWDVLKFGLIFLVVLGHICDQYDETVGGSQSNLDLYLQLSYAVIFLCFGIIFKKKSK